MDSRPIAFFDSGVGGLSILRTTHQLLPDERAIFFADSACFPYGARTPSWLRARATAIVRRLLEHDAKLVVVACNTATVHTLAHLRETFPEIPFVGVVPVVKTLAEHTRTGTIALLSTPATADSPYLADLIATFAPTCTVINIACHGLAHAVERGAIDEPATRALLDEYLLPVRASAADVLGLGCTHYPFLTPRISQLLGSRVRVYDSAVPVARRVRGLLVDTNRQAGSRQSHIQYLTTGDPELVAESAERLGCPADAIAHVDLPEPPLLGSTGTAS